MRQYFYSFVSYSFLGSLISKPLFQVKGISCIFSNSRIASFSCCIDRFLQTADTKSLTVNFIFDNTFSNFSAFTTKFACLDNKVEVIKMSSLGAGEKIRLIQMCIHVQNHIRELLCAIQIDCQIQCCMNCTSDVPNATNTSQKKLKGKNRREKHSEKEI